MSDEKTSSQTSMSECTLPIGGKEYCYVFKLFMLIWIAIWCNSCICVSKTFHLGILAPWMDLYAVGSHSAGSILIALDNITSDKITFSEIYKAGHEFTFEWEDTRCNPRYGIPLAADLVCKGDSQGKRIDVIFGGVCSVICEPAGYLAAFWNIPIISFGCISNHLSNKSIYPTLARTSGPSNLVAPVYLKLMQTLHYKRVAIFSGSESVFISLASLIRKLLVNVGIKVTDFLSIGGVSSGQRIDLSKELKSIQQRCKGIYNIIMFY